MLKGNSYINPLLFQEYSKIPKEERRRSDISFDISYRILKILERKGWSKTDLAKAMGKKESEVSKWVSGQHNFTVQTIAKIETVLGEDIISVKKYRIPASEYKSSLPEKRNWLNEPEGPKYK